MKKFFNEFKTFAIKGNMLDMAVGMIVGGAFTALVTSIVSNVATPLIGVDFGEWHIVLPRLYGNVEPSILYIGHFLNSIISFVIIAFVVFLFVKALNKFRHKTDIEPADPVLTNEELLLTEIRDLLKEQAKIESRGLLKEQNKDE